LNGIMMDEGSSGNVIAHNTVADNKSDGIVMANSSGNSVTANAVSGNRVGITIRGNTKDTVISGNIIDANQTAAQGTMLPQNKVYSNGGEWSMRRIILIWLAALGLLVLFLAATWVSQLRPGGHHQVQA
jgi:parallel beta-helix repeat protein